MKNVWSVLCKHSLKDEESKRISIINVVDSIGVIIKNDQVGQKIFINTPLELVSSWSSFGDDFDDFSVKIELFSPQKKILLETKLDVKKEIKKKIKKVKNVTTNLSIKSFPVDGAGTYIFKISQKSNKDKFFKVVSEIPVNIDIKISE